MPSILVVDEPKQSHDLLTTLLEPLGHEVVYVSGAEKALNLYRDKPFDIVVADNSAPMPALTPLLQQLRQIDPEAVVIMTDSVPDVLKGVAALRNDVFDYLKKPLKVSEFVSAINRGLDAKSNRGSTIPAPRKGRTNSGLGQSVQQEKEAVCIALVGENPLIVEARKQIEEIAKKKNIGALSISGANGSGKRYVLEHIHRLIGAPPNRLVTFDCAETDPSTVAEMLIGADGNGGSVVKAAAGGTLALSKINALPLAIQRALVQVLQNIMGQTLVIVTVDGNLDDALGDESFSIELYYYITIEAVHLPSLDERPEDLPLIVKAILQNSPEIEDQLRHTEFTAGAVKALMAHPDWSNLPELVRMVGEVAAYSNKGKVTDKEVKAVLG